MTRLEQLFPNQISKCPRLLVKVLCVQTFYIEKKQCSKENCKEGRSKNAPLLNTAFDWKTARSRAIDLNSSMHVIVELQYNVEQCVRAAKAPEDRKSNRIFGEISGNAKVKTQEKI